MFSLFSSQMRVRLFKFLSGLSAIALLIYAALVLTSMQTYFKRPEAIITVSSSPKTFQANMFYEVQTVQSPLKQYRGSSGETHHVALLKVHKTGSSTIQNIFLRFANSRNLTLIMAHDNKSLAENPLPNVISYYNTLLDSNVVAPPEGRHFDMHCCHVIYNRTQFEKFLPSDTVYIGIVRDPFTRAESAINFFNLFANVNLSSLADDPLKYDGSAKFMFNNRMAFEFGFPLDWFPEVENNYHAHSTLQPSIHDYLYQLSKDFDLILINEYFTESLVLMKRVLGWNLKDILSVDINVGYGKTRRFTDEEKTKLRQYMYLDIALYDFAVMQFRMKVAKAGDDFQDEVEHYLKVKATANAFCHLEPPVHSFVVNASRWNAPFTVTHEDCELFKTDEIAFIQKLRLKQYGRINI